MIKMLSGNEKYIFSRLPLYARAYVRIWTLRPWIGSFGGLYKVHDGGKDSLTKKNCGLMSKTTTPFWYISLPSSVQLER